MPSRLGYEIVFADAAVSFFISIPKRRQRRLLDRSQELAADPFLVADFQSKDGAGRDISHLIVDGFVFDYWVDHAAKQVIVTAIDPE